jgi:hypothetical protein
MTYINKKSKTPLSILLSGYIFSLGFYFIWCFYFFLDKHYTDDSLLLIVSVVFAITAVYLFLYFLILYIKLFQKIWTSFSIISTITLLIFFLIPSANNLLYNTYYHNKLNLKRDKTIKAINKNEPEREFQAVNNMKIDKRLEGVKENIETEKKRMGEIESKLNNSLGINDVENKSTPKLQAKMEYELKENERLKKQLDETIRKTKSLDERHKTKVDVVLQAKSNNDFSKINSETGITDLDAKNQEIIFKVQIITSDTPLTINSPKFKGIKNVWEYNDGGLYKYTVGNEKDLKSASVLQSELRRRGFVGAFVAAFKNGKRIPVREAKKLLTVYE